MSKINHYEFWAMTKDGQEVCEIFDSEEQSKAAMSQWCFDRYDDGWFAATLYGSIDANPEFSKKLARDRFAKESKKGKKKNKDIL